ncbi:hypothetical protein TNCV_3417231 [Trichonephila clavipes]|nr:hypothetical protein TNCV_3417231 [Trichonephila clavipes]
MVRQHRKKVPRDYGLLQPYDVLEVQGMEKLIVTGAHRSPVYATPVDSKMDPVARIICVAADIQQSPGVLEPPTHGLMV